jgi:hypothetical protein
MDSDIARLKEIHEKFYKEEFLFEEFLDDFKCAYTILDDNEIVCCGGIKLLAESVIMTDKDKFPRVRKDALLELLNAQLKELEAVNYSRGLHAFVQDERWIAQLIQYGFRRTKGQSLVIG